MKKSQPRHLGNVELGKNLAFWIEVYQVFVWLLCIPSSLMDSLAQFFIQQLFWKTMQSSWLIPSLHLMSVREENSRSLWGWAQVSEHHKQTFFLLCLSHRCKLGFILTISRFADEKFSTLTTLVFVKKSVEKIFQFSKTFQFWQKKSIFQKHSTLTSPLIHYCLQLWQQLWIWISPLEYVQAHTLLAQHITWEGSVTNIKVPSGKTK